MLVQLSNNQNLIVKGIIMTEKSLYERLGCYDGISEFVNNLLPRLQEDNQLRRFWDHRGTD